MDKLEQSEKQKNKWKNRVSQEIKLAMNVQKRLMPKRDIDHFPIFGLNTVSYTHLTLPTILRV